MVQLFYKSKDFVDKQRAKPIGDVLSVNMAFCQAWSR